MFGTEFLVALISIIIIDIVLGGDNAIVIAMACRRLPGLQRRRAIILGTMGAVTVRVGLAAVAVYLLMIPYLKLAGGLLLLVIAARLLKNEETSVERVVSGATLMQAVKIIIVADVAMGLDNVLAVAGAAHGNILLILIGIAISIPLIVWGSTLILRLMEKTPLVIYLGAGVLAWTAGTMIVEEERLHAVLSGISPHVDLVVPSVAVLLVMAVGYLLNNWRCDIKRKPSKETGVEIGMERA